MPRFLKGTTDHDSDGKMGGSLKETKMVTKKTAAKKAAAKPTIKADGQNQMNTAAAAQAEAVQEGSKATAESGQAPGPSPKEQRAKLNEQFEKADEKARQAIIDETQVGLQVRGW
jgi:2-phospho-L-lactate guanylyltransferase (CobY/MobA/RfbA family)